MQTRPRKQPAQARSRYTVEQILEAAARVFEERGYAGSSTNHIAERAGVSVGSLYQYFPNKDAILVQLLEQHFGQVAGVFEEIRAHVEETPHDLRSVLRHFVKAMLSLHALNPRLQQVLLAEAPRPPHIRAVQQQLERAAEASALELLQVNPEVRVADLEAAAYLVVHTIEGLTHEYVTEPPGRLSQQRFIDGVVAMLLGYLRGSPSGLPPPDQR